MPIRVSLEAHTTRESPWRTAAENTLYVVIMLTRKVSPAGRTLGAGIAARWATASAPARTSCAWPRSVRSATSVGASGSRLAAMSTSTTSWPCSTRSATTARPAFPDPPVTTTLMLLLLPITTSQLRAGCRRLSLEAAPARHATRPSRFGPGCRSPIVTSIRIGLFDPRYGRPRRIWSPRRRPRLLRRLRRPGLRLGASPGC